MRASPSAGVAATSEGDHGCIAGFVKHGRLWPLNLDGCGSSGVMQCEEF